MHIYNTFKKIIGARDVAQWVGMYAKYVGGLGSILIPHSCSNTIMGTPKTKTNKQINHTSESNPGKDLDE